MRLHIHTRHCNCFHPCWGCCRSPAGHTAQRTPPGQVRDSSRGDGGGGGKGKGGKGVEGRGAARLSVGFKLTEQRSVLIPPGPSCQPQRSLASPTEKGSALSPQPSALDTARRRRLDEYVVETRKAASRGGPGAVPLWADLKSHEETGPD